MVDTGSHGETPRGAVQLHNKAWVLYEFLIMGVVIKLTSGSAATTFQSVVVAHAQSAQINLLWQSKGITTACCILLITLLL